MRNRVFVEIDEAGNVTRIIKSKGGACFVPPERLRELPRKDAVEAIRKQVFERDEYLCRYCGKQLTWHTGHCDEIIPKSKGGEVALSNCQLLCAHCHIGPKGKHSNRWPQF